MKIPLYTIGHGNRSLETFFALLARYDVAFLIDVRSQPYSRYNPHFSKAALEVAVKQRGLSYVFLGAELGGRPSDHSCYVGGKVDYELVRAKIWFQQGIDRLRVAWEKQLSVALLCSELRPEECHRSKLIGNTLLEQRIEVAHIDEEGELKGQQELNLLLMGGQLPLFEDLPVSQLHGKVGRSRKTYAPTSHEYTGDA